METCFSKVTKSLGSSDGAALALAGLGPGWLSTPRLFSQINQEASQCRGSWGFKISSSEVSWSRNVTWSWTEVFSGKVFAPFSLSPTKVLWTPLTFLISCPFPERGEDCAGRGEDCGIIHAFLSTFHPKTSPWKLFLFKKFSQRSFRTTSSRCRGGWEVNTNIILLENCKQNIWTWKWSCQ